MNWFAELWEVGGSKEKPIIDVRIRTRMKFHNGDPVTASDFEFSYERLRDPKQSRWSFYQDQVERFEVMDELRFRIHFTKPDAVYITNFLQLWAMPKRYFNEVGIDGFAKAPVGTGPWKFVSWRPKDELKLEAFDDYWNRSQRPTVKNLTIKFIPEDSDPSRSLQDWRGRHDRRPPALTAVRTASCSQREPLFPSFALVLQSAGLAGSGPIATQCLAVPFVGIAID